MNRGKIITHDNSPRHVKTARCCQDYDCTDDLCEHSLNVEAFFHLNFFGFFFPSHHNILVHPVFKPAKQVADQIQDHQWKSQTDHLNNVEKRNSQGHKSNGGTKPDEK